MYIRRRNLYNTWPIQYHQPWALKNHEIFKKNTFWILFYLPFSFWAFGILVFRLFSALAIYIFKWKLSFPCSDLTPGAETLRKTPSIARHVIKTIRVGSAVGCIAHVLPSVPKSQEPVASPDCARAREEIQGRSDLRKFPERVWIEPGKSQHVCSFDLSTWPTWHLKPWDRQESERYYLLGGIILFRCQLRPIWEVNEH